MPQEYISVQSELDSFIRTLRVKISTVNAARAGLSEPSKVFCNVVFNDGSLLGNRKNFRLDTEGHDDFEPGKTDPLFELPIPDGFGKRVGDIDEFYIRVSGSDGWLLGSALLFANNFMLPVIGNSEINQFLDSNTKVLFLRDWSTKSLISSSDVPAKFPLLSPKYRIAGPVLGQISDTTANIVYRVDREGDYRLRVHEDGSDPPVFDEVKTLSPTATFRVRGLQPNTHYTFSFFHVLNGEDVPQTDGGGAFRTFPDEGTGVKFSLAFGSCARNRDDVAQSAWTAIRNLAADPSTDPLVNPTNDVRLFIHLGDSFYFYDDVTDEKEPKNLPTVLAANLSARKHLRFLDMGRAIPCCAVWDDHDFRIDDGESPGFGAKVDALKGFLNYWGNDTFARADDPDEEDPLGQELGLATRVSYGNVDIYLMDGRFERDRNNGSCFGDTQIKRVLAEIDERANTDRLVILATGGTWNHANTGAQDYGDDKFEGERESLYRDLNARIGNRFKGLVFLSGNLHINELYEVVLASEPGGPDKVAPEFVSSPLGNNSLKKAQDIGGERKLSFPSKGPNARTGFATLDIDTTSPVPEERWTIRVNYHHANASLTTPYRSKEYTLSRGQFKFEEEADE